jgi:hypothetical protein
MTFINYLENIKYPSKQQKEKELWDVEGIIKNKSNQILKFDLRPLSKYGNSLGKEGNIHTKADKMVFEEKDKWILIDIEEMHQYLIKNKIEKIYLQDLIYKLDWNIILPKK